MSRGPRISRYLCKWTQITRKRQRPKPGLNHIPFLGRPKGPNSHGRRIKREEGGQTVSSPFGLASRRVVPERDGEPRFVDIDLAWSCEHDLVSDCGGIGIIDNPNIEAIAQE